MQSSFFSYSSKNLQQILPYEQALIKSGLHVLQDKTDLHSGKFWSVRLSEAINRENNFILFWSVEAQSSSFVTLEWNIASALGKSIIPIVLDNTPLPILLRNLKVAQTEQELKQILIATPDAPQATAKHQDMLKQLENAPEAVDKVLEIVTQHIQHQSNQNNWEIQGNVYQVEGDLHLPDQDKSGDSKLSRWAAYATILATIITAIALFISLELPKGQKGGAKPVVAELITAGVIQDADGNPLADVAIKLPEQNIKIKTNALGRFQFMLQNKVSQDTKLYISKAGYQSLNERIQLGDQHIAFLLLPKK